MPRRQFGCRGRARRNNVGFLIRNHFYLTAQTHLATQRLPMEAHGRLLLPEDLATLLAFEIGIEDKPLGIIALQQDHADVRQAMLIHRGQRHGIGIVDLALFGIAQP